MAEQQQQNNSSPQAEANKALGSAMMGELSPFPGDDGLEDHSEDIANIFGLGEEAGPAPNSSEGGGEGGASPSDATHAAERQGEQAKPATPSAKQPQSGQQGEQTQAPAQQPQPAAPAAPPATPADGQAQTPTGDASVQALTAQVQALIAQNAQLQAAMQQGAGQQAPQPSPGEQPQQPHPLMDYRLALPNDVVNAVFNEDPQVAAQGLTHVVNSIGRIVHERVIRHVDELMGQRLQDYGSQQQLTQQQEQMRNEYFRDFPAHNNPGTKLIVAQEAQRMWTENPLLQWDDKARAALGTRVNTILGATTPQQQQQGQQQQQPPQQNGQVQPAPRPAAQMGASNRPAANPSDNEADFMVSVLTA